MNKKLIMVSDKVGLRITDYDNMLFPQYEDKFEKTIPRHIFESLQKAAKEKLEKEHSVHPLVAAHWMEIVGGKVPFGYTKMKRTMKWHTEGYIDTDVVWEVAAKKALKNMDRDSLRRLLNEHFGLWPTQADYMTTRLIWLELQRRNKEENKMEDNKYYSGSVAVTTWKERKTFKGDYIMSNHRSDLITFKDGRYFGVLLDPKTKIMAKIPINLSAGDKKYTKEDIAEAITTAWDKGEYAEDQTDISWIFNPDPEGFSGTVDLATVLLKDPDGDSRRFGAYCKSQVRARCRVRIVDGTFFEKLDGSSKLADILKNHKGVFTTKEDIVRYIKDKWRVLDFGNDASYFTLDIEEES